MLATANMVSAQNDNTNKNIVMYDPLFWKDKLKLDDSQCQKIRQINSEYYEKLTAVVHESSSHQTVKARAAQTLIERSDEIWETFHPKQRKRWKKLWQDNNSNTI
jgi:hypothetical protein